MDYIKSETLAIDVIEKDDLNEKYFDLNGHEVYLDVERVSLTK